MSKQDRQGARTPADLERKYGLGGIRKNFSDAMGASQGAKASAAQVGAELAAFAQTVESGLNAIKREVSDVTEDLDKHFVFAENTLTIKAEDVHHPGMRYAFQAKARGETGGYTALAVLAVSSDADAPITFTVSRRGAICPMILHMRFDTSEEGTEAVLASFCYEGEDYGAFLAKTADAAWTLYVEDTGSGTEPCVQEWYTTKSNAVSVSFPPEQIEALPEDSVKAVSLVSRSILDFVMPVGYVMTLYTDDDPNTLYPGTVWEVIDADATPVSWHRTE